MLKQNNIILSVTGDLTTYNNMYVIAFGNIFGGFSTPSHHHSLSFLVFKTMTYKLKYRIVHIVRIGQHIQLCSEKYRIYFPGNMCFGSFGAQIQILLFLKVNNGQHSILNFQNIGQETWKIKMGVCLRT